MSIALCTNPAAVNYNPQAKSDDGSCLYLESIGGVCYAFQDVDPSTLSDKSWTLSYSLVGQNWVFYHDYIPDFYFSVRKKLYALSNNRILKFNAGNPGNYDGVSPKSFFIDVVFNSQEELTLNAINWMTSVINADDSDSPFETLTHITIWNSKQCTGRIPLSSVFSDLQYSTDRKTEGKWSFNDFRDKVATLGVQFLQDLFNNFAVIDAQLSDTLPWFSKQLLEDLYFVVRFEFDNVSTKKIYLEETGVDTNTSFR